MLLDRSACGVVMEQLSAETPEIGSSRHPLPTPGAEHGPFAIRSQSPVQGGNRIPLSFHLAVGSGRNRTTQTCCSIRNPAKRRMAHFESG